MSKIKHLPIIIISSLAILFAGCAYVANKAGYEKKDKIEKQIEEVKKQKDEESKKKIEEIEVAKEEFLDKIQDNFAKSTENVYGAKLASDLITEPKDRIHNLIDYKLGAALAFAPPMSTQAMLEQNDLLKRELDESKTTLEQLQTQYNAKRDEANAARAAEDAANKLVVQKEKELFQIREQKDAEIQSLQEQLNEANRQIIAESSEKELEKKEESKRRMWLVTAFGIAALAAGAGAIFSPIFKKELGIAAAASIGLSVAAAMIPVWVVTATFIGVVLIAATPALIKAIREYKVASSTYVAIQEVKDKNPEMYAKVIKPKLIDAQGEYTKDGKVVQNEKTKDFIDQRLMEMEVK